MSHENNPVKKSQSTQFFPDSFTKVSRSSMVSKHRPQIMHKYILRTTQVKLMNQKLFQANFQSQFSMLKCQPLTSNNRIERSLSYMLINHLAYQNSQSSQARTRQISHNYLKQISRSNTLTSYFIYTTHPSSSSFCLFAGLIKTSRPVISKISRFQSFHVNLITFLSLKKISHFSQ